MDDGFNPDFWVAIVTLAPVTILALVVSLSDVRKDKDIPALREIALYLIAFGDIGFQAALTYFGLLSLAMRTNEARPASVTPFATLGLLGVVAIGATRLISSLSAAVDRFRAPKARDAQAAAEVAATHGESRAQDDDVDSIEAD